jgi:hypothetical protein
MEKGSVGVGVGSKKLSFFLLIFLSACASSPQVMRSESPYYEDNLNRPIVSAIDCVSKGIDKMEVGIFASVQQGVKYLPNSEEGSIYLSSGNQANIAIIDFSGTKNAGVKLFYNTNVLVVSDHLTKTIEQCRLP